jgi:anti-sigma-K factor RskA
MEEVMTMFKARANPSGTRPRARTAARSLDREITVARWCVLAAAFTVLLVVVLAHIGG